MPRRPTIAALALAGLALILVTLPAQSQRLPAGPIVGTESRSQSVGYGNRGRMLHSAQLEPTEILRLKNASHAYGTQEMVDLLMWASREVERHHPSSSLLVGDISRERGGRLRPHRSHRAGRDVDIGFYLTDAAGEPATDLNRFVRLRANGRGGTRDGRVFEFDDARNWALVSALMAQDRVPIQYVMVVRPFKERLLAEGRRQNAPQWLLDRVEEAVGPRRTRGSRRSQSYGTHDSHFHVRIYCDASDRPRCKDKPPFWPWVDYPAAEEEPPARPRRRRARRRRTSS